LQAFSSSIAGLLANRAVLEGMWMVSSDMQARVLLYQNGPEYFSMTTIKYFSRSTMISELLFSPNNDHIHFLSYKSSIPSMAQPQHD